jgi:spore coat protein A
VLAEFFGDTILVNGVVWPRLPVEPRQYRLRLLNGSDSAFYSLQLKPQGPGRPADIVQIGTDGGFLYQPVPLNGALVLAPGERADVLVDFSAYAGRRLVMTSNAPQPFPFGVAPAPTATQIMAFDVANTTPLPGTLPHALRDGPWAVEGEPARTRRLLLFEGTDDFGRIFAQLGTVEGGPRNWDDPVTETVENDSVEIWEVFNTTPDAHPIHLHLPQFEVLDRAPFRASQDPRTGGLRNVRVGPAVPASAGEKGPKDTAQMFPGEVTRIKARFDRPGEYVWHCHILSHEDHEMMRRYVIE